MMHLKLFIYWIYFTHYLVICDHDALVSVGSTSYNRANSDTFTSVSLIPNDFQTFTSSGQVMSFTYSSTASGIDIKFQIWRKGSGTSFTLIHESSTVTTTTTGTTTHRLSDTETFTVLSGDTLGVVLLGSSPLRYSIVSCSTNYDPPLTGSSTASVGDQVTFSSSGSECREYSFSANVLYDSSAVTLINCTQLTALDGFIGLTSPGYNGVTTYSIDINQCWVITPDSQYAEEPDRWGIEVQVLVLDFEEGSAGECVTDSLTFKNGDSPFGTLLDELCGAVNDTFINSTSSSMYIRMYTDSSAVTVATGFTLQYRIYEVQAPTSANWKLAVGLTFALLLLIPVGVVIFLWFRLKKQRDREDEQRLKDEESKNLNDDDFAAIHKKRKRLRSARRVSPQMMRREKSLYRDPKARELRVDANKEQVLRSHIPRDSDIPEASDYRAPKKSGKLKHWSQLSYGVTG